MADKIQLCDLIVTSFKIVAPVTSPGVVNNKNGGHEGELSQRKGGRVEPPPPYNFTCIFSIFKNNENNAVHR